jgi:hypothetical protein
LQISADFETALFARLALKVSADASLRVTEVPASGSNFGTLVKLQRYPRNILYIPVVEIFPFLELEQISADFENYHFSKVSNCRKFIAEFV